MFDAGMLAQGTYGGEAADSGLMGMIFMGVFLVAMLLTLVGMWRVFSKAGQPGWGIFVPFYNCFLMCRAAGRPGWWTIPTVLLGPIFVIILSIDIAKQFGKGTGFGLGLAFLPFPFYPMLGFGKAQYGGGSGSGGTIAQGEMRDAA